MTSPKALVGAIRAAWKSTECGMAPLLVSVILTSWPWRTWITGPGAPPAQAQAEYLTPGAIWMLMSVSASLTFATGPAGTAGSVAGYGLWAAASASAFAGAAPAKLVNAPRLDVIPGMAAIESVVLTLAWLASSRALR